MSYGVESSTKSAQAEWCKSYITIVNKHHRIHDIVAACTNESVRGSGSKAACFMTVFAHRLSVSLDLQLACCKAVVKKMDEAGLCAGMLTSFCNVHTIMI